MYKVLLLGAEQNDRFLARKFPWLRYGFDMPMEATCGEEAIELLSNNTVDLVLTEAILPDMDCLELLRKLPSLRQTVCVVLLASAESLELVQQALARGAFDYVMKPCNVRDLGDVLQRVEIFLQKFAGAKGIKNEQGVGYSRLSRILQQKRNEWGNWLVEGADCFMAEAARWHEYCQQLPEAERRIILQETMNALYESFDKFYPWIKNIEMVAPGPLEKSADFMTAVEGLYEKLSQYELLEQNSLFRAICVAVQENVEKGVSLGLVADILGITPDYAGRVFKRKSNVHFTSFVMRTKMERGKELLSRGDLRNYQISSRLGYSNPDYFRQLFKAYTGMTPNEYRNSIRRRLLR